MKPFVFQLVAVAGLSGVLAAEPVAEGTYVDLIIVPVGPAVLAEFEADSPPVTPEKTQSEGAGQKPDAANPQGPGGGGGSGIRVKARDPSEIPPSAFYIRHGKDGYYQIPCSLNAVGTPVRTPVRDSEIVLYQRDGTQGTSFKQVAKFVIKQSGDRMLVVLTKALTEKKWNDLNASVFRIPKKTTPQLFFVNGCEELNCGVKVADRIMPLAPLKPLAWEGPVATSPPAGVDVALAMQSKGGALMPAFFQSNVELKASTTSLFIAYGVSREESFRGGKFALGSFDNENFRTASAYRTGN